MPKLIKIVSITAGIAILSFAWLAFSKPVSPPPPGFTDFDFRGDYAFSAHTDASGGVLNPSGVIGRFTSDGHGHITDGIITLSGRGTGVSHHESLNCSYAVRSNGTGRMTCVTVVLDGPPRDPPTSTGDFDLVLVDGGKEFYGVNTTIGEVQGLVTTGKRQ